MHSIHRTLPLGLLFAGVLCAVASCGPTYPNCETDKDCQEHKEFCVARTCQKCRDTRDCPAGQQCSNGKCGGIQGYCTDRSQCGGQECIGNRCRPCESDGECGPGLKCMQGQCKKAQCATDNDCPQDKDCQNGVCVGKPQSVQCKLDPVYFGFDQATLTSEGSSTLNGNADSIKKGASKSVDLVGRADPRGTTEYNMALSDRRAQAVKDYLQRMGIDASKLAKVPRGASDATGTDESGWAKDRRVDFECR